MNAQALGVKDLTKAGDRTDERKGKPPKNPAAVALGRLGGKKGGLARAQVLSADQRREIAQKAANARWRKDRER